MMSLARLGLALSAAGLAVAGPATADSATTSTVKTSTTNVAASEVPLDMPVEPVGNATPIRGGWTRDGWSDATPARQADAPRVADARPDARLDDGPPPRDIRYDERRGDGWGDDTWGDTWGGDRRDGEWRRQTWDGGRGPDYRYRRGERLAAIFTAPRYIVPDWPEYGLRRPGPGQRWVRYYGDAVLLDPRGYVVDAVPGIGWDDSRWRAPDLAYDDGYRHQGRWRDDGVAGGATWGADGSCYHCAPGTTVVTTRSPGVATTTTTTTISYVTVPRRVWTKPVNRPAARKPATKLLTRNR